PLSPEARKRIQTLCDTNDGFKIAEVDLQLRGPGEYFGTRQHGLPDFRIADLTTDAEILEQAQEDAFKIAEDSLLLKQTLNRAKRYKFLQRYYERMQLAEIG
ncbi:MAG: DNA helicase RecG, partial [Calditrichaeota bacterium]